MGYQVLARKWRPRFFKEMVGQAHVLQALINALDHNRLHHAYLFTGTRGVGKTTIARILAKCLNCDVGVSSEPCGQCSSCLEIAQGNFVDLIEIDAASYTGVDNMRELIDNAQYRPSKGRYKVYIIDEVHMLSKSAFNALLKTLEEPPEYVKFLLATTDPQKLPATVLSRCLQFNLKNMSPETIVGHLQYVLTQESMTFDEQALWSLARSASGSMRDALSLTDQAIAFGLGDISAQAVSNMLGSIDQQTVYNLMQGLIDYDAQALMAEVARLSEHAPDYSAVLDELLMLIHRLSLAQLSADCVDNSEGDKDKLLALACQLSAEELQLFYQMAILGKRDLGLAPDLRTGFEMTLIRLLTFKPVGIKEPIERLLPQPAAVPASSQNAALESQPVVSASAVPVSDADAVEESAVKKSEQGNSPVVGVESIESDERHSDGLEYSAVAADIGGVGEKSIAAPLSDSVELEVEGITQSPVVDESTSEEVVAAEEISAAVDSADRVERVESAVNTAPPELNTLADAPIDVAVPSVVQLDSEPAPDKLTPLPAATDVNADSVGEVKISSLVRFPETHEQWLSVFSQLPLQGLLRSIAAECVLQKVERQGDALCVDLLLNLSKAQLFNGRQQESMGEALQVLVDGALRVNIQAVDALEFSQMSGGLLTVYQNEERLRLIEQNRVETHIHSDRVLASVMEAFDAQIIDGSIKPL